MAKVGKKVFVFMGMGESDDGTAHFTVKLPESHQEALSLPFSETPGYGLDRGHWVTIHAPPDAPLEMLTGWVEESYRAGGATVAGQGLWTADDAAHTPPRMLNPNPPRMITVVAAVALILVGDVGHHLPARLRECRA